MPLRTPNLLMGLGFCQCNKTSNFTPTRFNIISSGLKWISKWIKQKATEQEERRGKEFECLAFLSFSLSLTMKLLMLKALISRMFLALKYRRMLLMV